MEHVVNANEAIPANAPEKKAVSPKQEKTVKKAAPAKKEAPKKEAPTKEAKAAEPTKKDTSQKITLLSKECPSKKGSTRAKRWAKLSSGMTVDAAREAGVPLSYLKRMAASNKLKLG